MTKNKSEKSTVFLKCGLLVMAMAFMLSSVSAQSQSPAPPKPKVVEDPNRVYIVAEKMPKFPGGMQALGKFLGKNIKYPAVDRENDIQGQVIVQFIVEPNGSLSDVKALRSPTDAMAKEAVRVISMSPKWKPGMQNGKAVRAQYTMPVSYTLSKG